MSAPIDHTNLDDLQDRVIHINRVAKVVKGGRRFQFQRLSWSGRPVRGHAVRNARNCESIRKLTSSPPRTSSGVTYGHHDPASVDVTGAGRVVLVPAAPVPALSPACPVRAGSSAGIRDILSKASAQQQVPSPRDARRAPAAREAHGRRPSRQFEREASAGPRRTRGAVITRTVEIPMAAKAQLTVFQIAAASGASRSRVMPARSRPQGSEQHRRRRQHAVVSRSDQARAASGKGRGNQWLIKSNRRSSRGSPRRRAQSRASAASAAVSARVSARPPALV